MIAAVFKVLYDADAEMEEVVTPLFILLYRPESLAGESLSADNPALAVKLD